MKRTTIEQVMEDVAALGLQHRPPSEWTPGELRKLSETFEAHQYPKDSLTYSRAANMQTTPILTALNKEGAAGYAAAALLSCMCGSVTSSGILAMSLDDMVITYNMPESTIRRSLKILQQYGLIKCVDPGARNKPTAYAINGCYCKVGKARPAFTDDSIEFDGSSEMILKFRTTQRLIGDKDRTCSRVEWCRPEKKDSAAETQNPDNAPSKTTDVTIDMASIAQDDEINKLFDVDGWPAVDNDGIQEVFTDLNGGIGDET